MQGQFPFRIRYSTEPGASSPDLNAAAGPLLEIFVSQSHSDGVYFYRLNGEERVLELAAWRGLRPTAIQLFQVEVDARVQQWLLTPGQPQPVNAPAWLDWRFENLPEFVENRFETALTIPLATGGVPVGILNVGRRARRAYSVDDVSFAASFQTLLASLLTESFSRGENARLQAELQRTNEKLAGRRQIERARGILQSRYRLTEEDAYFHLRRLSRNNRKPMREIARHVIEGSMLRPGPAAPVGQRGDLSATDEHACQPASLS